MEIVIKEDDSDLEKELRESKALFDDGIDISKFLREDLSINLELLEVAISFIVDNIKDFHIYGLYDYYKIRNIWTNLDKQKEEVQFIRRFIKSSANELSETGKKEVYFNG